MSASLSHKPRFVSILAKANFSRAIFKSAYLCNANLKGVSFDGANLRKVNFTHANLAQADFFNTKITDNQLRGALSIRDARLPNGSLGRDPNLVRNGYADCNMFVRNNWQVPDGDVTTIQSQADQNDCRFVSRFSSVEASMWQRIDLTYLWNSAFWSKSR